jgi:hypothetical protein
MPLCVSIRRAAEISRDPDGLQEHDMASQTAIAGQSNCLPEFETPIRWVEPLIEGLLLHR